MSAGVKFTPSHIDYSQLLNKDFANELVTEDCVIVTGFAKELVPVDKGQLKNSVSWTTKSGEDGFNDSGGETAPMDAKVDNPSEDLTGYVGSNLEYAGAVEYGRSDMPNYPIQPYLRPSVTYSKSSIESRHKKLLKIRISEAYHG